MQVTAAILLLIPRTALLGAFIYFPIILNICILSLAVRFDGSQVTSPLMLCAVLFLLCWDYHKFKNIFPFNLESSQSFPDISCNTKSGADLPISIFWTLPKPPMFSQPAKRNRKNTISRNNNSALNLFINPIISTLTY